MSCDGLVKVMLVGSENELANNCIIHSNITIAARPDLENVERFCELNYFNLEDLKKYRSLYIDELKLRRYADEFHFSTAEDAYSFMKNHPAFGDCINECMRIEIDTGRVDSLDVSLRLFIQNDKGKAEHDKTFDICLPMRMFDLALIMTAEKFIRKYGEY